MLRGWLCLTRDLFEWIAPTDFFYTDLLGGLRQRIFLYGFTGWIAPTDCNANGFFLGKTKK